MTSQICELLQRGRVKDVKKLVEEALEAGMDPKVILNEGLLEGMSIIGGKFKRNEVFVPEVLVAARAMTAGLSVLEPKLVEVGNEPVGKAVIGTVKGDLHDIGKNLVAVMLKGAGFEVVDLGTDVEPEDYIEKAEEEIEIVFENKDAEVSTGSTYGTWLTHPAFTSFDSNGMWVGKFESGLRAPT